MIGYLLRSNPPHMYHVRIIEEGFAFDFSVRLYEYICKTLAVPVRGVLAERFEALPKTVSDDTVSVVVQLPYMSYPNLSHKKLDHAAIAVCAEDVQLLFDCLNSPFMKEDDVTALALSTASQHVVIRTTYWHREDWHVCGMEVGFSPVTARVLAHTYRDDTAIPVVVRVVLDTFLRLSESTRRGFLRRKVHHQFGVGHYGISCFVRGGGVPSLTVPGNCACLGANPDDFQHDFELSSHNLDMPLQQMAMLAGVVSFWNDVVKPLHTVEQGA